MGNMKVLRTPDEFRQAARNVRIHHTAMRSTANVLGQSKGKVLPSPSPIPAEVEQLEKVFYEVRRIHTRKIPSCSLGSSSTTLDFGQPSTLMSML